MTVYPELISPPSPFYLLTLESRAHVWHVPQKNSRQHSPTLPLNKKKASRIPEGARRCLPGEKWGFANLAHPPLGRGGGVPVQMCLQGAALPHTAVKTPPQPAQGPYDTCSYEVPRDITSPKQHSNHAKRLSVNNVNFKKLTLSHYKFVF